MPEKIEKSDKIMGMELRELNDKIITCLLLLKEQRDELAYIIEKQFEERKKLETEMERITYKLCLINKSLAQRIQAKENYDKTIAEIEDKYNKLVENSGELYVMVQKELDQLDSLNNKKTGTEDAPKINQQNVLENVNNENSLGFDAGNKVGNYNLTKDGKGDREPKPTNSSQTNEIEVEMPTKLEKGETRGEARRVSHETGGAYSGRKWESASNDMSSDGTNGDADNMSMETGELSDAILKSKERLLSAAHDYKMAPRDSIES